MKDSWPIARVAELSSSLKERDRMFICAAGPAVGVFR